MAGIAVGAHTIDAHGDRSATWVAFDTRRPVLVADAASHPEINQALWIAHGRPASMLFEPVQRDDRTIGARRWLV
jgi:hypothetical protein